MALDDIRLTTTVAQVLRVFLEDPGEARYGFDLMRQTRMPSGTLYPILARLEKAGWITSQREAIDPVERGRPQRRMYLLTTEGAETTRIELARLSAAFRPPGTAHRTLRPEGGSL
jgi:DNA-binding PadR family transcriptional regulator